MPLNKRSKIEKNLIINTVVAARINRIIYHITNPITNTVAATRIDLRIKLLITIKYQKLVYQAILQTRLLS